MGKRPKGTSREDFYSERAQVMLTKAEMSAMDNARRKVSLSRSYFIRQFLAPVLAEELETMRREDEAPEG